MARRDRTTTTSNSSGETGLLTRFVPDRFKHSAFYRLLLRLARVLQFLSAIISLGIFSSRLYKIYRLVNSIKLHRGVSGSYGAVEGILAAAVLYTLVAMLMSLLLKGGGPKWLRWLWVLLDLLFVGAFIAVAVLTRPNGGSAGPRHCFSGKSLSSVDNTTGTGTSQDDSCNLPWGTFILAIVSTLLHALTAAFHEVRDRYREHHAGDAEKHGKHGHANGVNGHNNGHVNGQTNDYGVPAGQPAGRY